MAVDYFLQITGIEGESMDAKHKGWLDVESWSWGETNRRARPAEAGAAPGKVQVQDLHVTTRVSKASPKLFLACASGQHMKEAKLAGGQCRQDPGGVPHVDVQRRPGDRLPDGRDQRATVRATSSR